MVSRDSDAVVIVTATRVETLATLRWARGRPVLRGGIALRRLDPAKLPTRVLSCGLAGSLSGDVPIGGLVVPDFVQNERGQRFECDPDLTSRLRAAAARLGASPLRGGLLTSSRILTGGQRSRSWGDELVAVDMEAALAAERGSRVAAVKVVLDTLDDDLTLTFARWRQLVRLAIKAPALASLAGRIAAAALEGAA